MSRSRRSTDWVRLEPTGPLPVAVSIVGVGEADHSNASGRDTTAIAAEAVERALADAGLSPRDVDGIMWHPSFPGQLDDVAFHEHFGTSHDLWTSTEGGGMTWAATAPLTAARAIAAGEASVIVNAFAVAWATQRTSMVGGPGATHAGEHAKRHLEIPFGWFPQPVYFATIAQRHMHEFGTTEEQLGAVAVTLRRHASAHPTAVMRDRPLTIEQYLASPPVATPLRKEDCSLISDGGGAYVMTSGERAADLASHPVDVASVGLASSLSGVHWAQQTDLVSTPQVLAAPAAFEIAGIGPDDVDVLGCYDPFTIVSLMQIEDMGFCDKGGSGPFAASGALAWDSGVLPYNTHGGLLSHAYVLGIAHVVELVRQLRGEAANQVAGAEIGVYGGYTGPQAATLVMAGRR